MNWSPRLRALPPVAALMWACGLLGVAGEGNPRSQLCRIEVVEKGTDWPVPLVELRSTHQARFFTDNAGVIAFDLPELMGGETWFDVIGNG